MSGPGAMLEMNSCTLSMANVHQGPRQQARAARDVLSIRDTDHCLMYGTVSEYLTYRSKGNVTIYRLFYHSA